MDIDKDLGLMYISEQTSFESMNSNLVDRMEKGLLVLEFDAVLHTFGDINRNQRSYDGDNVMKMIETSEKIQSLLRDNLWAGEWDHPQPEKKGEELSPQRVQNVKLGNRSHLITNPRRQGNMLIAHIITFPNSIGEDFAKEILILKAVANFSCRSIATIQYIGGKPVVIIRKLITYDRVLYPSHKEAHAITTAKLVNPITESTNDIVNNIDYTQQVVEPMLIPLKEILSYVGEKDPNNATILEAFDLDIGCITGFTPDHKQTIIKDRDNLIYCNIRPETKHKVDDFFYSFK